MWPEKICRFLSSVANFTNFYRNKVGLFYKIGEGEGPRAGGERGAPHDGGQGLQAEGQTPPLRARDQHRRDQGGEYGVSQGTSRL